MGVEAAKLSLLDNPEGFIDYLNSLNPERLSEKELQELVGLLTKEYRRADDLLSPENFAPVIRPYNGRLRGFFRSVQFSPEVNISEPYLGESYGRTQIEVALGKQWAGRRATFHGSPFDRKQLTAVFIRDRGNQGFVVTINPPGLRPLGENEGF